MARRRLRVRELSRPTPTLFFDGGRCDFYPGTSGGFFALGPVGAVFRPFCCADYAQRRSELAPVLGGILVLLSLAAARSSAGHVCAGPFLLYPLLFLRGVLLGFSFSALFAQGSRLSVFLHFFFTALLTCAPLLLEAVSGMLRGSSELHRHSPDESGIFSHPVFPLAVLLAGAGLIVLCCIAELWLLPSFVAHIQSFTQ